MEREKVLYYIKEMAEDKKLHIKDIEKKLKKTNTVQIQKSIKQIMYAAIYDKL